MSLYRRNFVAGGCFFFTVNLVDRRSSLLVDNIDLLRHSVRQVKRTHPFYIDAWVVMPDHLHAIWRLPDGDYDYPMRWRQIKANFSRSIPSGEKRRWSRINKGERGIWQRRYWEHTINCEEDWRRHMDYVHFNPVKHGYVTTPDLWQYSSFSRAVRQGLYEPAWGRSEPESIANLFCE